MPKVTQATALFVDEAAKGNARLVLHALKTGQDVNAIDSVLGHTALHVAAEFGHYTTAKVLLDQGADVNRVSNTEVADTALHRASAAGRLNIAELLLTSGADKTIRNGRGESPLDMALAFSKPDLIFLLGDTPNSPVVKCIKKTNVMFALEMQSPEAPELPTLFYEISYKRQGSNNHNQEEENDDTDWIVTKEYCPESNMTAVSSGIDIEEERERLRQNPTFILEWETSNLDPATTYAVRIRANNRVGYGEYTDPYHSIRTDSCVPSIIREVTCPRSSPHTIRIKWEVPIENGFPILHYQVRYRKVDETTSPAHDDSWTDVHLEISRTFVTVDELMPGQVYAFSIRASNELGFGKWSDESRTSAIYCTAAYSASEDEAAKFATSPPGPIISVFARRRLEISILLQWSLPALNTGGGEIDEYSIKVREAIADDSKDWIIFEDIKTPCYDIPNLVPETEYHILIRAHNAYGWGGYSLVQNYSTKGQPPGQLLPPECSDITSSSVTLSWNVNTNNASFRRQQTYEVRIYCPEGTDPRYTTSCSITDVDIGSKLPTLATGITNTTLTVQDLLPATTYSFTIRAHNSLGWGPMSSLVDFEAVTTKGSVPFVPLGLSVVKSDVYSLTLQWIEPPSNGAPVEAFEIFGMLEKDICRSPFEANNNDTIHPAFFNEVYTDANAFTPTAIAEGSYSDAAIASPVFYEYNRILRSSIKGLYWHRISSTIPPDAREFEVQNLRPWTYYCFAIRVRNEFGWSEITPDESLAVGSTLVSVPFAPPGLLPAFATKTSLCLRWDTPRDNGLSIQRYRASIYPAGKTPVPVAETTVATTEFTKLTPGVGYMVSVQAKNEAGWGPLTEQVVYTESDIPDAPHSIRVSESEKLHVLLKWGKPATRGAEIAYYEVQFQCENDQWHTVSNAINETEHLFGSTEDYTIFAGETYNIRLRAKNAVGWGNYCEPVCILISPFKPYGPSTPSVIDISPTSMTIAWEVPVKTGGSDVDYYELQFHILDLGEKQPWVSVDTEIRDTMFVLFDLRFKQYVFRVRAHNEFGWGEFSSVSLPVRVTRRF